MILYEVNFEIRNDIKNEYNGFENVKTAGYFEPGWSIQLLYHDIIEHFFEFSKFFSTSELSQAGECVALGIRSYLSDTTGLVYKYAAYNTFQGVEWNTWNTIISQVKESDDPTYATYTNDFEYSHLPSWDKKNIFEGYCKIYDKYGLSSDYYEDIELAVSYGYYLGEYLFKGRESMINNFLFNLEVFLKEFELDKKEMWETSDYFFDGMRFDVKVKSDNIVARLRENFRSDVLISSNIEPGRSIKQFYKNYHSLYEYYG